MSTSYSIMHYTDSSLWHDLIFMWYVFIRLIKFKIYHVCNAIDQIHDTSHTGFEYPIGQLHMANIAE